MRLVKVTYTLPRSMELITGACMVDFMPMSLSCKCVYDGPQTYNRYVPPRTSNELRSIGSLLPIAGRSTESGEETINQTYREVTSFESFEKTEKA